MKKKIGRLIALFLAALLAIGTLSQVVFASDAGKDKDEIKVTRVIISNPLTELRVGRTANLRATVRPRDADNQDVYWYSSDEDVAEIDEDGKLRTKKPGYVTITAEGGNGKRATMELVVPGGTIRSPKEEKRAKEEQEAKKVATKKTSDSSSGKKQELSAAQAIEEVKKANQNAAVVFANVESVSAKTLQTIAQSVTNSGKLHFDTKENKSIQGRLSVEPAQAKDLTGSILPGVYTSESKTKTVANRFRKHFYNDIAVIRCEQEGSYGMPVSIAAKVDVSGLKADKLKAYSYNPTTNTYGEIEGANSWIDKNGYVHVHTSKGDYIVVSNGDLVLR